MTVIVSALGAIIPSFRDNNNNPLVGGTLLAQVGGVNYPTYVEPSGTVTNTNPIVLNSRGEIANPTGTSCPLYVVSNVAYTFTLFDALGNQIWSSAPITAPPSLAGVLGQITQAFLGTTLNPQSVAESSVGLIPTAQNYQDSPFYDMNRYGIQPNGANNTVIVQAVFNMLKVTGGTMYFPFGDWAFYLDISGTSNKPIVIEGNGSTFRCFTATPAQSCVVFANNSGAAVTSAGTSNAPVSFTGTNVEFRNCNFTAQLYSGGASTGDLNCAVALYGCNAKFWKCNFNYGKYYSFYGMYTQYSEFWSCGFYLATSQTFSCGCLLDSNGNNSGSNEVTFMRCYFQVCANGLYIRGAFQVRLYGCNFQGLGAGGGSTGTAALVLASDSTGFGCVEPLIDGCWFEVNTVPHIYEILSNSPRISRCCFFGGGSYLCQITSSYTLDWAVNDCMVYGTTMNCTLNYPAGGNGYASVSWHGNNFVPTLNLGGAATSAVDIQSGTAGLRRNDNMLLTTGQAGTNNMPLVQTDQYGFHSGLARTTNNNVFAIKLQNFAIPQQVVLPLMVELYAWQDTNSTSAYGYCGRVQRFYALIANTSGTLVCNVSSAIDGADLGTSTASQAIGVLTLTAVPSGSVAAGTGMVTFQVSFPGAGSSASSVTSATVAYTVRGMGGNPFTLVRL